MRNVALPDDLFAHLETEAARRGVDPGRFVVEILRHELAASPQANEPPRTLKGRQDPLPSIVPAGRLTLPRMTNAEIFEMLDREEEIGQGRVAE